MPSFSSNYSLNLSYEILNCCTQFLLRYFGPNLLTKDTFKDSTVVCGERYTSVSNVDQKLKSIGLRSGDEGGNEGATIPCSKTADNYLLLPSLGFVGGIRRSTVLLEWEISIFEVLFRIMQSRCQNVIDVHICVDFGILLHKNQRIFSSFWNWSSNHDRCWLQQRW